MQKIVEKIKNNVPIQNMNQELFNKIVEYCINNDDRQLCWLLYFEYASFNPAKIEDFYIAKRDSFYACELISIAEGNMDIDNFINKIIATKDTNFIAWIELNPAVKDQLTNEQHQRLRNACKNTNN